MGCVRAIYRKMELRSWLVHGNVRNNRINLLNEKVFVDTERVKSADLKTKFFFF